MRRRSRLACGKVPAEDAPGDVDGPAPVGVRWADVEFDLGGDDEPDLAGGGWLDEGRARIDSFNKPRRTGAQMPGRSRWHESWQLRRCEICRGRCQGRSGSHFTTWSPSPLTGIWALAGSPECSHTHCSPTKRTSAKDANEDAGLESARTCLHEQPAVSAHPIDGFETTAPSEDQRPSHVVPPHPLRRSRGRVALCDRTAPLGGKQRCVGQRGHAHGRVAQSGEGRGPAMRHIEIYGVQVRAGWETIVSGNSSSSSRRSSEKSWPRVSRPERSAARS